MAFDPNEARDQGGRWTRGGDSDELPRGVIDPRAVDVAGDKWNQDTAKRLESEYAAVRPDLDAIVTKGIESGAEVGTSGNASSWDDVSSDNQESAQDKFIDQNHDSYYDSEVQNWSDSGDALNDAKSQLADDGDFKEEFLADFIKDRMDNDEEHIPYTAQQLSDAMEVSYQNGEDDPEVTFNTDFLSEPDNVNPNESAAQMTLPGIEVKPIDGKDSFKPEMEDAIRDAYIKAFNEKAEKNASNADVPDYINENTHEAVQSAWQEMSDEDKLQWTKDNTQILEDEDGNSEGSTELALPDVFDPMNETSGDDYRRTQAIAKYLSDNRAAQLITERTNAGIIGPKWTISGPSELNTQTDWIVKGPMPGGAAGTSRVEHYATEAEARAAAAEAEGTHTPKDAAWTERMLEEIQSVDNTLWSGWKGSSTGSEGRLLQVAAADELGGRLREAKPVEKATLFGGASTTLGSLKFAKGVLDPANPIPPTPEEKAAAQKYLADNEASADEDKTPVMKSEAVDGFIRLPEVNILRNGAASTTISRDVANGWSGTTNYAPSGIDKKAVIDEANKTFKNIGGYEGVKAAIRAKWETTQYLLDRADMPVVQAYRGITMPHKLEGDAGVNKGEFNPPSSGIQITDQGVKTNLANYKVGDTVKTQSGKTITKASDKDMPSGYAPGTGQWTYDQPKEAQSRIVMRAEVPRTAVVSVPAYGVNVHSEQEVVVVGTAWRNWDAWSGRAPSFDAVPMGTKPSGDKTEALATLKTENAKVADKEMADLETMVNEVNAKKKAA